MANGMFIIYNKNTTMEVGRYKQEKRARDMAASNKDWDYCPITTYYDVVVKPVERVNMMSGKTYVEASNTPSFMSPASETFWSM